MPELAVADVVNFTGGRLPDDGPTGETQRMLDAALQVARRETMWHVSPERSDEIEMDGPNSRILWLPTLRLVELDSVIEDDVELDLSAIKVSKGDGTDMLRRVALRKTSRGWWSGEYGAIVVSMTHGFDEAAADDWRQAILSMVDQMSLIPVKASTGMSDFGQSSYRVDDVQVGYNPYATIAQEIVFSIGNIIDKYRLPHMELL